MPKQTATPAPCTPKELDLDSKISVIRKECQQLKADREYMQVRVNDVCREIDALVSHFTPSKELKRLESDTSESPSPDPAKRNSLSLISLDGYTEPAQRQSSLSRSSLSIDDATLKSSLPGIQEMGPPSCPPLIRSLQSSPNARIHRKRVTPLDEVSRIRSTSYLKAESARNRSNSQQSLPDTISRDTQPRDLLIRAKSGDVRAATKMSLSSSSPTLTCKDSTGNFLQHPLDKKESVMSQLASKTCTDL
ncbi:hypothetical protein LOD99_1141 [Oopsacas minuta]|uniref:Uncharacterized protein n=1 Tax=Oopsacas minuta TaxID=111878 RepID=A0AAV7K5V7_9METZ|nr:hypothetical protein LOD99_1141 [Oopsacas minuta]